MPAQPACFHRLEEILSGLRSMTLLCLFQPAICGTVVRVRRPCESGGCPSSLARINPTEKGHFCHGLLGCTLIKWIPH